MYKYQTNITIYPKQQDSSVTSKLESETHTTQYTQTDPNVLEHPAIVGAKKVSVSTPNPRQQPPYTVYLYYCILYTLAPRHSFECTQPYKAHQEMSYAYAQCTVLYLNPGTGECLIPTSVLIYDRQINREG
jgi:hypothetical protein